MRKKAALGAAALLLMLLSNLHLACRVSVNGRELEGLYSPGAADRALTAAVEAAGEILAGPVPLPELKRAYCLCFKPPAGDGPALTQAVLLAVPGVRLMDAAYVNGTRLGVVEDGAELMRRLESFIVNQQPHAAVSGRISGQVRLEKCYSSAGRAVNYDDMVLLVTGMAPVIYVDENGKLA